MQLFRTFAVASGMSFASGMEVNGVQCSINAARAMDEMMDSALWTWTSVERCKQEGTAPGHGLRCEMDISRAAESIAGMANVIVHALEDCGSIRGDQCGIAAGKFIQSAAGMSAAAGGIWKVCAKGTGILNPAAKPNAEPRPLGKWAWCLLDAKDSLRSLMKAVQRSQHAQALCEKSADDCGAVSTGIISAIAALGEYATAAVGHCQPTVPAHAYELACSSQVMMALRHTSQLASDGSLMASDCKASASRLYELDAKHKEEDEETKNGLLSVTSMSLMMLPIAAVMSFLAGKRFGKNQPQSVGELGLEMGESRNRWTPLSVRDTDGASDI